MRESSSEKERDHNIRLPLKRLAERSDSLSPLPNQGVPATSPQGRWQMSEWVPQGNKLKRRTGHERRQAE
jgi:hypothetical protein